MSATFEPKLDPGQKIIDSHDTHAGVDSSRVAARALLYECIENHPEFDTGQVADYILKEGLPAEAHDYVLREGLSSLARKIAQDQRRTFPARPVPDGQAEPNHSARWENVRKCADVFQQRWPSPSGRTMMLGDFTRADAEWAVTYFQTLAAGATNSADKFEKLASVLPKSGKPAHSLPREQVEAIFNA